MQGRHFKCGSADLLFGAADYNQGSHHNQKLSIPVLAAVRDEHSERQLVDCLWQSELTHRACYAVICHALICHALICHTITHQSKSILLCGMHSCLHAVVWFMMMYMQKLAFSWQHKSSWVFVVPAGTQL